MTDNNTTQKESSSATTTNQTSRSVVDPVERDPEETRQTGKSIASGDVAQEKVTQESWEITFDNFRNCDGQEYGYGLHYKIKDFIYQVLAQDREDTIQLLEALRDKYDKIDYDERDWYYAVDGAITLIREKFMSMAKKKKSTDDLISLTELRRFARKRVSGYPEVVEISYQELVLNFLKYFKKVSKDERAKRNKTSPNRRGGGASRHVK